MQKLTKNQWIIIVVVLGLIAVGYIAYNNTTTNVPNSAVTPIGGTAAPDSFIESQIAQYNIMKSQNAMPDQCVMANTISMLYLQKQDEAKYAEWKDIGKTCEDAYMASMGAAQ